MKGGINEKIPCAEFPNAKVSRARTSSGFTDPVPLSREWPVRFPRGAH